MGAAANSPGPSLSTLVEWRANLIDDPVDRLRYLRQAVEPKDWHRSAEQFRRAGGWRKAATALLWASFLMPVYTPSRAP